MTQLGEAVSAPEFLSDEEHNEKTCPWHEESNTTPDPMEVQEPDEDQDEMPANLGTKLGKALGEKSKDTVQIAFAEKAVETWNVTQKGKKRQKSAQIYKRGIVKPYDLQYAPHHLIPGNESLKGSEIVAYLGDDDVIKNFKLKGEPSSMIKDKNSVGYDVNREENGVWLPSPYALSMSNKWPSEDGLKRIKKRHGQEVFDETEDFKHAYVAAAIEKAGDQQFHMRHSDYSNKVRNTLDLIGDKLKLMAIGACPIASNSNEDDKFDPPMGLKGRLDLLSGNLKRLLTGDVWRPPIYTDDKLMSEYVKSLNKTNDEGEIDKIL